MNIDIADIDFQKEIRDASTDKLRELADFIRDFLIKSVAVTGGHLASNLGVCELTLAIHKVFDVYSDRLVWDVGHQSYIHKILTDRAGDFGMLRSYGGISGFPKTAEHPTDVYNSGHSSTSISAAMGMAEARDSLSGKYNVIAVIGDGSLTGGLAFEGLQNIGTRKSKLIVILNDNQMSISSSKGSLSQHLSNLRSSGGYIHTKKQVKSRLRSMPLIGGGIYRVAGAIKRVIRHSVVSASMFEELGLKYYGPVDGHSIPKLISVLEAVKDIDAPVLIHVVTKKGKGYVHSEAHPWKYHGVGPFDIETGMELSGGGETFSDVAGETIVQMAKEDGRIASITAAMTDGVGLTDFARLYPERFYDTGIAEEHAVTFAAGLSMGGIRPFVFIYSTFLQRAYDQIMMDVCAQNLPVIFMIDRAGVVGKDGETHHGVFDLSYLTHMPNLIILAPCDGDELRLMMKAALSYNCPVAIRYPRGSSAGLQKLYYDNQMGNSDDIDENISDDECIHNANDAGDVAIPFLKNPCNIGKSLRLYDGNDVDIRAVGNMVKTALEIRAYLSDNGISCGVVYDRFVKPIDEESLLEAAHRDILIVTIEDNVKTGGFGSGVSSLYLENSLEPHLLCFGWPDEFIPHGDTEVLHLKYGLTSSAISLKIEETWCRLFPERVKQS